MTINEKIRSRWSRLKSWLNGKPASNGFTLRPKDLRAARCAGAHTRPLADRTELRRWFHQRL